jgi:hypothetical protein
MDSLHQSSSCESHGRITQLPIEAGSLPAVMLHFTYPSPEFPSGCLPAVPIGALYHSICTYGDRYGIALYFVANRYQQIMRLTSKAMSKKRRKDRQFDSAMQR